MTAIARPHVAGKRLACFGIDEPERQWCVVPVVGVEFEDAENLAARVDGGDAQRRECGVEDEPGPLAQKDVVAPELTDGRLE